MSKSCNLIGYAGIPATENKWLVGNEPGLLPRAQRYRGLRRRGSARLTISRYGIYRAGHLNGNADALSRISNPTPTAAMLNGIVPTDLDECGGHTHEIDGEMTYHYHLPDHFPLDHRLLQRLS